MRDDSAHPRVSAHASSRDEMNLAEFPLTVLSTRVNTEVKTLEFTDTHRTKSGELVERKWIITGADKFGLPTSTDDDVVLGLICLTMDNGFRDRKVYFTRYELLKILRWTSEGRSYQRLTKSLDRLSGVRIRASNAFFDNTAKAYQTVNFGIIDAYEINDERSSKGTGEPPKSFFIWSEKIFDSFKAGFIKKLDLDVYFSLRSAVSRRLYRYLDKHFYYRSVLERPLMPFAFEKLGLSRTYKFVSSIKQQIEPAAEELVQIGFLQSCEFVGRGEGTVIRFTAAGAPGAGASGQSPNGDQTRRALDGGRAGGGVGDSGESVSGAFGGRDPRATHSGTANSRSPVDPSHRGGEALPREAQVLLGHLVDRGIAFSQASKLMTGRSAADLNRIEEILRYYDFLVQRHDRRVSKSPVGFLYRAVESPFKFTVPAEFQNVAVGGASGSPHSSPKSNRPELRVVRAEPSRATDNEGEAYKRYVEVEVAKYRAKLPATELAEVYQKVLSKVSCLQTVLESTKFDEAVQGCVFDELKRSAGVVDFATWRESARR